MQIELPIKYFSVTNVDKSTVCNILGNESLIKINRNEFYAVCTDNFVLKKRHHYGTLIIDINSHKIIDMINSRKKIL